MTTEQDELVERIAEKIFRAGLHPQIRNRPSQVWPTGRADFDGKHRDQARAAIAECEKVSTVEIEKLKDWVDAMKHFYLLVHNRANKLDAEAAAMREALKHADSFIKNIRVPQNSLQVVLQINDGGIVLNAITSALSPDAGQRVLDVVEAVKEWRASLSEDGWSERDILSDRPRPAIGRLFKAFAALGGEHER